MGRVQRPKGNEIHVFSGAAETVACPYGEPFADLPTSFVLAAPTASGKTMIILNLLLRYYKDMFARIWVFSPSIKLDPQYEPLRKYLEKMSDQDKEPLMFEDLDQQALGRILNDQRAISKSAASASNPSRKSAWSSTTLRIGETYCRSDKGRPQEAAGWSPWRLEVVTLAAPGSCLVRFSTL